MQVFVSSCRLNMLRCWLLPSRSVSSQISKHDASNHVLLLRKGAAGVIQLNRSKALNALNLGMIRHIYPTMIDWEKDPSVSHVIICSASFNDKAFCAGGDIVDVVKSIKDKSSTLCQDFFGEEYTLNHLIGTFRKPYVALIDGITMGGGVGLSVHGSCCVATERTLFAMPETAIGLIPDVGGGFFLPRLKGQLGIFLALTGHRLRGIHVRKAGIATHFVDSAFLPEVFADLTMEDKKNHYQVHEVLRRYEIRSQDKFDEPFSLGEHLDDIDRHFAANSITDILVSLKSAADVAGLESWPSKQLAAMRRMSPTSMAVTLRQLRIGANLDLRRVLEMEYRIVLHSCEEHDFPEGVRALLLDKDNSPKWKPSSIEEITEAHVDKYFAPLRELKDLCLSERLN